MHSCDMDSGRNSVSFNADEMVYTALLEASSQHVEVLKQGEEKLKTWEVHPGFYTTLCNILSNNELNENARWLAALCFKNGIEKYWRTNAPNGIAAEEKRVLRSRLMGCCNEPVSQLASQMAVIISKIARFDCPNEWPELLDTLFSHMRSTDSTVRHRAVLYLCHVLKSLSSKRLCGDRKFFQELSSTIYPLVLDYWNINMIEFARLVLNGQKDVKDILSVLVLSSKILQKLTDYGFAKPHQSPEVCQFISSIFERIKSLLEYRVVAPNDCVKLLEKLIVILIKVLLSHLEDYPCSCVQYIRPILELSFHYGFTPEGSRFMFPEVLIRLLNLMKLILTCSEYKEYKAPTSPDLNRPYEIKTEFFTPDVLDVIVGRLISEYFLLTRDDLLCWETNPEAFVHDDGGECWKYNLRPCTESLFMAVTREYSEVVTEIVCSVINTCKSPVNSNDIDAVLKKEAIYTAFGLVVFELFMDVEFDGWFQDILIPEMHDKSSNNRIIRRRISWLIAKWTAIKFSNSLRPLLYSEMVKLLEPNEDMVVRLTTCNSIKEIIDDFDFDSDVFASYIPQYFHFLYILLEEVSECETKMRVLHVLSFVIERVGWSITPHLNSLVQYLPLLWQHSADHNMLRATIVSTLTGIVKGLKKHCTSISSFLSVVIECSLDLHRDGYVYLMDNGLQLLLALVENMSSDSAADIIPLFAYVLPIIEMTATEHLNIICPITQAYLLISPDLFLQTYGEQLVTSFDNFNANTSVLHMYELCLRINADGNMRILQQPLQSILRCICTTRGTEEHSQVTVAGLSILARLIIHSVDAFGQLVLSVSNSTGSPCDELFSNLLDIWLTLVPSIVMLPKKKLWCIAFLTLLTSKSEMVLLRFNTIVAVVIDVIHDIVANEATECYLNSIIPNSDYRASPEFYEEPSEHYIRKSDLDSNDIADKTNLLDYFRCNMALLETELGHENFLKLVNTVDEEVMDKVKSHMNDVPLD